MAEIFKTSGDQIDTVLPIIKTVFSTEANAIKVFGSSELDTILNAVTLLHECKGPVIVSGIGKSGYIGQKISSTFRSLGKKSSFLHPAEASHGDLGIIHDDSIVLVLSHSGETTELADLLFFCNEQSIPIISITASKTSTLGKSSKIVIAHGKLVEACINGLAPTTSTTLALAIGDALAIGVSHQSNLQPSDFRRYHPGGKLGTRLLTVRDVVREGVELPFVLPHDNMNDVVVTMSKCGYGVALVIDDAQGVGLITDGDLRRNVDHLWQCKAADIANFDPLTVMDTDTAVQSIQLMNENSITCVIVKDKHDDVVALLHIHDCLRLGL